MLLAVAVNHKEQNYLIYPIVYLYRHHIELALKNLIILSLDLLNMEIETHITGHKIDKLWKKLKPLLNPVCESANNSPFPIEDLDGIDSYISQIADYDPDGQRFRYSVDIKGGNSIKQNTKLINIRVFADALEKLSNYLDGINNFFSELQEMRNMGRYYD